MRKTRDAWAKERFIIEHAAGDVSMEITCRYTPDSHYGAWTAMIVGTSRSDVENKARRQGWILHRDGTATCRECNPAF
jgi:hypothetical protein